MEIGVEAMRWLMAVMLLLGAVALAGCDQGEVVEPEMSSNTVSDIMKPILEKLAENGDVEQASEIKSYIEEDLAAVDPAKSEELMKDWQEIRQMSDTEEIKAKAQEMLSKL
jgi:hypothetical protein